MQRCSTLNSVQTTNTVHIYTLSCKFGNNVLFCFQFFKNNFCFCKCYLSVRMISILFIFKCIYIYTYMSVCTCMCGQYDRSPSSPSYIHTYNTRLLLVNYNWETGIYRQSCTFVSINRKKSMGIGKKYIAWMYEKSR